MARSFTVVIVLLTVVCHLLMSTIAATNAENGWVDAHATFYGGRKGQETMRMCFLFIEIYLLQFPFHLLEMLVSNSKFKYTV